MKKLTLLFAVLLTLACFASVLAESEEFIPRLRFEEMEPYGISWTACDKDGAATGYSVSSWGMQIIANYDLNGDLISYQISSDDFSVTVEYDLLGNIIDIDMDDEAGISHHYDMAQQCWLLWSPNTNSFSIPDDTDLEIDYDLLPSALVIPELAAGK